MSLEYTEYQPTTPAGIPVEEYIGSVNNRKASYSSIYSSESSPWSTMTGTTSPTTSPTRHHHGPALLPKIRSQDAVIEPVSAGGPLRPRRVKSNTPYSAGYAPYPLSRPSNRRDRKDKADPLYLMPPLTPIVTSGHGVSSALSSPVTVTPKTKRKASGAHSRSVSTSVVDDTTLLRWGFPTYRELPKYVPAQTAPVTPATPVTPVTPDIVVYPSYPPHPDVHVPQIGPVPRQNPLTVPTPRYNHEQAQTPQPSPMPALSPQDDLNSPSTNLLTYLTTPTQAINLVRNVSVVPTRGMHDYFWWDIRNLRSWKSFSLPTFDSMPRLTQLLKLEIPGLLAPPIAVLPRRLAPESEPALVSLIRDLYAPRINAALAVSQGEDHLKLYTAPDTRHTGNKNHGNPHFLANYANDSERTGSGLPRGRLVGIVKSFDRWNSGMRNEAPHRRVEYLNGLAHLQRCMREHSCRYGFIITEIELVCVRAGCAEGNDVPYFGFLEISSPIPLKTAAVSSQRTPDAPTLATPISSRSSLSSSYASSSQSSHGSPTSTPETHEGGISTPMTASLALYFLLMLSKSVPLPHQPSARLNVGAPGALTRQHILPEPKDKWIPEPQIGERRDAKRVRGWVWPHDIWHRREGGVAPRSRNAESRRKSG